MGLGQFHGFGHVCRNFALFFFFFFLGTVRVCGWVVVGVPIDGVGAGWVSDCFRSARFFFFSSGRCGMGRVFGINWFAPLCILAPWECIPQLVVTSAICAKHHLWRLFHHRFAQLSQIFSHVLQDICIRFLIYIFDNSVNSFLFYHTIIVVVTVHSLYIVLIPYNTLLSIHSIIV